MAYGGSIYYPAGAAIHFVRDEMVRPARSANVSVLRPDHTGAGERHLRPARRRRDAALRAAPDRRSGGHHRQFGAVVRRRLPVRAQAAPTPPAATPSHRRAPTGMTGSPRRRRRPFSRSRRCRLPAPRCCRYEWTRGADIGARARSSGPWASTPCSSSFRARAGTPPGPPSNSQRIGSPGSGSIAVSACMRRRDKPGRSTCRCSTAAAGLVAPYKNPIARLRASRSARQPRFAGSRFAVAERSSRPAWSRFAPHRCPNANPRMRRRTADAMDILATCVLASADCSRPSPATDLIRIAVLSVVSVITFGWLLTPVRVSGISMEPTYHDSTLNLVNRIVVPHPRTAPRRRRRHPSGGAERPLRQTDHRAAHRAGLDRRGHRRNQRGAAHRARTSTAGSGGTIRKSPSGRGSTS